MIDIEKIAQVCHETNRAYCEVIGDHSQKSWNEAEQWQRESAIAGVRFRLNNLDAPSSVQHDAWLNDKVKDGWKYGEVKDASAKTHPCIVPYDKLPLEQQIKDKLFVAVVKSFLS